MSLFRKLDPEEETRIMLGEPRAAVRHVAIPFLISLVIGQINMLADLAWCSGLGSESVSAIQAVTPLFWVVFDIGLGIGLGCNVLISRQIGSGDRKSAESTIIHGIILSIVIATVTAPFIYLLIEPMMIWMGAGEISSMGVSYLTPVLACNIFQVLSPTLAGFLRGEGAAKRSNYAMIAGTLTNIVLDPILIYGCGLGVMGAGIATAMVPVVSTVIMLYFYISKSTTIPMTIKGFRFNWGFVGSILYIGMPKMLEMFTMDALDAINRLFLIECAGIDAMVLFSVPFRIILLGVMMINALALSLTPVASANLGAKAFDKSRAAFSYCISMGILISACLITIYLRLANVMVIPFTMSDSMIGMRGDLADILRAEVLLIPAIGLMMVSNSMLQAMRMPMMALLMTFARTGFTTLSFMFLKDTTVLTMCIGMTCITVITSAAAYLITRKAIGIVERKECSYSEA